LLIVNADDWGRDSQTTQCIVDCVSYGTVTAVSAMVFMEDSARAAGIARERGLDVGLHLNFTAPFTASHCPADLAMRQRGIAAYLRRHRLAQVVFNPGLARSFEHVVAAQVAEFRRLYGVDPVRLDGHHHMHLSANVLLQGLLPRGTVVRKHFDFEPGEKGMVNRTYRRLVNMMLARRHPVRDCFFSLAPLAPPGRIHGILALAREHIVEVETHPARSDEYCFLRSGEFVSMIAGLNVATAPRGIISTLQADCAARLRTERNGV
jgi:predicted glycoside hydrolase/deacetylase ChbG (UPF0249 family)